jgi:hypothetical protein
MNLFVLSINPKKAAEYHLDKHVIKMILEACQLLYTAHWVFTYPQILEQRSAIAISRLQKSLAVPASLQAAPHSKTRSDEPGFRPVNPHHPCAIWVRQSSGNYLWAANLACELAKEYEHRWPGRGAHGCRVHAEWLRMNLPAQIPHATRTEFVQAMEDRFKDADPVVAYRRYYVISKDQERGLWHYTRRQAPQFVT